MLFRIELDTIDLKFFTMNFAANGEEYAIQEYAEPLQHIGHRVALAHAVCSYRRLRLYGAAWGRTELARAGLQVQHQIFSLRSHIGRISFRSFCTTRSTPSW